MYSAVIIDDESSVLKDLQGMMEMHLPQVNIVGTATRSAEGLELIKKLQPNMAFLDINIDDTNGIELASQIESGETRVIFVTAHQQYAVEAFKLSAVDYLLKPVDPDELMEAVKRASEQIDQSQIQSQLTTLAHNLMPGLGTKKIVLRDLDGMHIIDIPDILWCHANGSYTVFKMISGEEIIVSKHLKTYERILTQHGLVRAHRSYLVNIYNIRKIERSKGEIRMKNDETLPIYISADILKSIVAKLEA